LHQLLAEPLGRVPFTHLSPPATAWRLTSGIEQTE
jgi:hypothetical protein